MKTNPNANEGLFLVSKEAAFVSSEKCTFALLYKLLSLKIVPNFSIEFFKKTENRDLDEPVTNAVKSRAKIESVSCWPCFCISVRLV